MPLIILPCYGQFSVFLFNMDLHEHHLVRFNSMSFQSSIYKALAHFKFFPKESKGLTFGIELWSINICITGKMISIFESNYCKQKLMFCLIILFHLISYTIWWHGQVNRNCSFSHAQVQVNKINNILKSSRYISLTVWPCKVWVHIISFIL